MIILYALALRFDRNDRVVFDAAGGIIIGHTIKHVLSAVAVPAVVAYLARRRPIARRGADHLPMPPSTG